MGFLDRLSRLIRANLNAFVSDAEDPIKILDQSVADMQEDLVKLRQAVAMAIASQKRLENQANQAKEQIIFGIKIFWINCYRFFKNGNRFFYPPFF